MLELPSCRSGQSGAFTAEQARAAGLSRHQLQALLRSRSLIALRRGVYLPLRAFDAMSLSERSRVQAMAAGLAWRGSAISHRSALLVHHLPVLGSLPVRPELSVVQDANRKGTRNRTIVVRTSLLPTSHVDRHDDAWAVTSIPRAIIDVARTTGPVVALAALDAALHTRCTTEQATAEVAAACDSWAGGGVVLTVVRLADGRAESPYETLARWQLRRIRDAPVPQVWAFDRDGPIGRGDLWLACHWTYLEVDGDVKYGPTAPRATLVDEKRRQERLERAGFGVARITPKELDDLGVPVLSKRIVAASRRGRLARLASPDDVGYVGPPPPWATTGAIVPISHPPGHQSG